MRPRPPVRAFAVAAGLSLLAALLIVGSQAWAWGTWALVVGVLVALAALALVALAVVAGRQQQVRVELDEDGFTVTSPGRERRMGSWAQVTSVTGVPGRITVHTGPEERVHLLAPLASQHELDALGEAIGRRMDAQRGFTRYEG